ncbi:MAG: Multidrug resistance protein MdtA precursor [Pseudomonadota bacterium]
MTSRLRYFLFAVLGIAIASAAAWWYQNKAKAPMPSAELVSGTKGPAGPGANPSAGTGPSGPSGAGRAPAVEVAKVETMDLVDDAQTVGSLRSRQGVMMRPEVSGRVTMINFRDGERVRKGQLLVQLDDQLPLAQVKQSEAELSIAQSNHKRNQELLAQKFISQRTVDESAAALEVAQAKLALSRATSERLKILAPFDGIAGIRSINVGDYLKDGTDMVNIEDIDTLYVDYRLPERFQSQVQKGQRAKVEIDALPGRHFSAQVIAVDPLIDASGRSIGVRASIDNRKSELRPGMFARVTAVFGERKNALVVPEEAIVPLGGRLFVIKAVEDASTKSLISQRVEVKVGIRRPGRVEIVQGLAEQDSVVVAGQQRLQKDGTPLRVLDPNRPAADRPAAEAKPAAPAAR